MNNFGASEEGSIRQFPLLRQPWWRYMATYDSDAKAFEKRQYREVQPDLDPRV
jgi:hypothetical protein